MSKYDVSIVERFRGAPDARNEQVNMSATIMFTSLEDVFAFVSSDIKSIYKTKRVLRETNDLDANRLVKKILFERPEKHGRLLRVYTITPHRIQLHEEHDLI